MDQLDCFYTPIRERTGAESTLLSDMEIAIARSLSTRVDCHDHCLRYGCELC